MSDRQIITVDGLAGSGKTTLARALAERLGFMHLNSGLLYRAVAYLARVSCCAPEEEAKLVGLIRAHTISLVGDSKAGSHVLIDGVDRTAELQTPEISDLTSRASVHPAVREALIDHQRHAFPGQGMVAEGRDMGTVIFPQAAVKFFIHADEEVRVSRRLDQFKQRGIALDSTQDPQAIKRNIEIEIRARDKRDRERTIAPTKPASDATIIDNSRQTLTLVLDTMYSHALSKGITPVSL